MKSLKLFVVLLATVLAIAGNSPAMAEDASPDWVVGVQVVQTSAERHLAAIELVLAERKGGNVNPESLAELVKAHNELADALTASGDLITRELAELVEASVTCMNSPDAMGDECKKKLDATLVFADWAIDALAAQAKLALGLMNSEALLGDNEKSL